MDWISNGKYHPPGQCTDYAASTRPNIPAGLGNACDWIASAHRINLRTCSQPIVGAVAVYGRGFGYSPDYGHVAVVIQVYAGGATFRVAEGNWREAGKITTRTSSLTDVLGFIPPPNTPNPGMPAAIAPPAVVTGGPDAMNLSEKRAFVRLAYIAALGREPESVAGMDEWASRITESGDTADGIVTGICDSPEGQAWRARLRAIVDRG